MSEVEITGHVRILRADGEWFGAEDFDGLGDVPLRVLKVCKDDELKVGGKSAKNKPYLRLANPDGTPCKKRMILNTTRRRALREMYGFVTADWKDKIVWVYTDKVKNPDGGAPIMGMKFRINTNEPAVGSKQPKPREVDPLAEYRAALSAATTEAECRNAYEVHGNPERSGWSPEQDRQANAEMHERIAAVKGGGK